MIPIQLDRIMVYVVDHTAVLARERDAVGASSLPATDWQDLVGKDIGILI